MMVLLRGIIRHAPRIEFYHSSHITHAYTTVVFLDPTHLARLPNHAIEPPRSISGEVDGNVMVDIDRTHPLLTDSHISLPSPIPWKPLTCILMMRGNQTMVFMTLLTSHGARTPHAQM